MKIRFTRDYQDNRSGDIGELPLGVALTLIENRRGEPGDDAAKAEYAGILRQRKRDADDKVKRDAKVKAEREKAQKERAKAATEARKGFESPARKPLKPELIATK